MILRDLFTGWLENIRLPDRTDSLLKFIHFLMAFVAILLTLAKNLKKYVNILCRNLSVRSKPLSLSIFSYSFRLRRRNSSQHTFLMSSVYRARALRFDKFVNSKRWFNFWYDLQAFRDDLKIFIAPKLSQK